MPTSFAVLGEQAGLCHPQGKVRRVCGTLFEHAGSYNAPVVMLNLTSHLNSLSDLFGIKC